MDRPADMWAWAHETPQVAPPDVDASNVLAVLVAHNGEQWLPRTLVALARMTAQPGRLVAVDAGSTDGSRELLDKGLRDGLLQAVLDGKPDEGFGANVSLAVEQGIASGFEPSLLWFLHDDSAPSRHALTELLVAAQAETDLGVRPAIVVPKLLHPKRRNHPDQMSAVGESISSSGARVLTVEPGDIDQHQLGPARVLGASTAGMLITMAAWRQLGGFDPTVPLFRDGVDLGWRANAQGLVVRTWPKASLRHVEAGRVGLRDSVLAPDSAQADKTAGMAVVVKHAANPGRAVARLRAQSVLQSFGYLLGKSPSLARGQLRAAAELRALRPALQASAEKLATEAGEVPAGLLPDRGWAVRRFFDRIAGAISDQYYDLIEDDDAGMIDELTGDDFAGGRRPTRFLSPTIIGMLVMMIASLVASRQLMHFGPLSGPGLLPAPPTLGAAWAGWALSDPGLSGANAPWLGLMALGSTFSLGQPDWFATLLVLGGPALAGWSAFYFLRGITGPGWWTPALACLWGALLPLVGATGQGSIELAALAIGLPLLGGALRRWSQAPTSGAEGLRAPASVALLIGIFMTSMPWVWLVGLVIAVTFAIRRRDPRGGLLAGLGPIALIAPWLPRLLADPGRLLVGTDPAARAAENAPGALAVLSGGSHLPAAPSWLAVSAIALIWIVAVLGAIRASIVDRWVRAQLLGAALVCMVAAVLVTRFVVTVAGVGVRPDSTGWLLIGLFCLLVLAAHALGRRPERGVDDSADDVARRAAVIRTRSLLGVTLAVALLAAAGWWVSGGTRELTRDSETLPTYVSGVQTSDRATRTLMVDLSGGTALFNLTSATTPAWGSGESKLFGAQSDALDELQQVAQQFAQGQPSDDLAQRLELLGVGHVWLRGASNEAISALSSAPQLDFAPSDEQTVIFTVTTQTSRALVRQGSNEKTILNAQVPATSSDALIVLSEPSDSRWVAEIDGEQLTVADSGDWRQAWSTDGRSGTLSYRLGVDVPAVIWQVLALLVLLVLTAPTAQRSHSPRRALSSQSGRTRGGGR